VRLAAHGEVLLAASHESNWSDIVQAGGLAPKAQVPCPLLESDRAFRRIAHVYPNRVKDRAIKVVARWRWSKEMRR
jgi:hypothetical protein